MRIKRILLIIASLTLILLLCSCAPRVPKDFVQIGEIYEGVKDFSEGFASVKKDGKWGVIDTEGNQIVDFIYEDIWYYREGLCAVKTEEGWGFIDTEGNPVIEPVYDAAWYFSEGLAAVKSGELFGYIDAQGNSVTEFIYKNAGNFGQGIAYVSEGGAYGYINAKGELVSDYQWFEGRKASEGLIEVFDNDVQADSSTGENMNNSGFIDTEGNLVIDKIFYDAESFSEGLCAVKTVEKKEGYTWGYVNRSAEVVIPYRYAVAGEFSQGRAAVSTDHLYGYIDAEGNSVTEEIYTYAYEFSCGRARVGLKMTAGYDWQFIGLDGNTVIKGYSQAKDFCQQHAAVCKGEKWGMVDTEGNLILPCSYDAVGNMSEGIVWLRNGSKYVFAKYLFATADPTEPQ